MTDKFIRITNTGKKKQNEEYQHKFDKLMKVLYMLDKKKYVTRRMLADMFNCSERSVYRHIKTLKDTGHDINYDKESKSYRPGERFSMTRSGMTNEETLTFGIAKEIMSGFGRKTAKVMDAIEHKMQAGRSGLPSYVVIYGSDMRPEVDEYFRKLDYAIGNLQQVRLVYRVEGRGAAKDYIIEPYYLFFRDGSWYLRAHRKTEKKPSLFTLGNIKELEVLDKTFLPKAEITPDELRDAFGSEGKGEEIEVILRVRSDEYREELKKFKMHPDQEMRDLGDGRVEISYRTKGNKAVRIWKYPLLERMWGAVNG